MTRLKTIESESEPTSEAELRKRIVKLFRDDPDWTVRSTSDNRKTRKQLSAMSDLMLRHKDWDRGRWVCVEVKFGAGSWHWSSPEQEESFNSNEILAWFWLSDAENFKKERDDD